MFTDKRYQEIIGIVLILFSVIFLISLLSYDPGDYRLFIQHNPVTNTVGPLGALFSHLLRSAFGLASFIIAVIFAMTGYSCITDWDTSRAVNRASALVYFMITLSSIIAFFNNSAPQLSGGYTGLAICRLLTDILGRVGSFLVITIMNVTGLILLGILSLSRFLEFARDREFLTSIVRRTCRYFSIKKIRATAPMNSVTKNINGKDKLPWIVKKKIVIYEVDKEPATIRDSLKYLEMSVPLTSYPEDETVDDIFFDESSVKDIDDSDPAIILERSSLDLDESEQVHSVQEHDPDYENVCDLDEETGITMIPENTGIGNGETGASHEPGTLYDQDETAPAAETGCASPPELLLRKVDPVPPSPEPHPDADNVSAGALFDDIPINQEYIIPTSFLCNSEPVDPDSCENEIRKNSGLLVNTLNEFGIESRVVNVNRGPVITLYEMQIAPGIKVNRIVGLADDIAMALAASRVRVVAPIPGKSAIGIELPNSDREIVTLGDIITSEHYHSLDDGLIVGLGKDILGKPVTLDIKKLPHLLIAGATGSGKSVCVNSIITSLIYNYDPGYVRFIMVDPKMVELQLYDGMPHLLTPVITEPHAAPIVLKWAMYEMERRYYLLSEMNTRDISRYNSKMNLMGRESLPFIMIIIDELADLMMVASKEIENYITRIAQKARAVGIHLVLATQRPSVDIITGIIKANFPARIAFQVPQKTDSRTIIDQNGAEKLLGKGDMLYQSPSSSFPRRIQGAFISEDEILRIVTHLKSMGSPHYIDIEETISSVEQEREIESGDDELFVEALKIIEETRKASASYLQRRLSIGYNRAARIIELMEDRGYVGPQQGSKPREILI